MVDYVKALGPFPEWLNELRQIQQDPTEERKVGQWTYHAQRGASDLLAIPRSPFKLSDLRTSIECVHEYFSGKLATLKNAPPAMVQCVQDELEFNITNIPISPECKVPKLDGDSRYTYALLRPLTSNFNCYIYAAEMQDALNRIDAFGPETVRTGGIELGREIEYIRELAGLLLEKTRITIRLFWAAGPGKDLVTLSIDKPWHELTNLTKDFQLHLNSPLEEIEKSKLFDAAFAAVCLKPEESGPLYGDSVYTQLLAMDQAMSHESASDIKRKYPYALQMAMGEYGLALELLDKLPPVTSPPVEPHRPKTLAVRLNIAQSTSTQICTSLPFVRSMCDRRTALESSVQLWETHDEIRGIFARELKIPNELIGNLFPCLNDTQPENIRWTPIDEYGNPLEGMIVEAEESGSKRKRGIFQVGEDEYATWKRLFRRDGGNITQQEIVHLFQSVNFSVERLAGSFIRIAPPNNAGVPFIIRIPVTGTYSDDDAPYTIPLAALCDIVESNYGWSIDWFTVRPGVNGEIADN
uniref:Uncharacterized protein n=1 Tax=Kwoniella dejecticola CBS 10117 TaxID=1296121 RepID=A0A1A6A1P4_9TREE|nr:uncharacterized protein I303_06252 [Kwoniella dejecticola CBS 10117]OBR83965.1 hypothetical protein I303_06252 [Kwoniella dejecticola CBS 10117]